MLRRLYLKVMSEANFLETNERKSFIYYRRENIENPGKKKVLITAEDFREHQANCFASAIAMPKPTFVIAAKEILKKVGISGGGLSKGQTRIICSLPSLS